jgi:hypothetical protein
LIDIFSSREVIFFVTLAIQLLKESEAKLAEPTGCPRSLKPVVSSIEMLGKVLSGG